MKPTQVSDADVVDTLTAKEEAAVRAFASGMSKGAAAVAGGYARKEDASRTFSRPDVQRALTKEFARISDAVYAIDPRIDLHSADAIIDGVTQTDDRQERRKHVELWARLKGELTESTNILAVNMADVPTLHDARTILTRQQQAVTTLLQRKQNALTGTQRNIADSSNDSSEAGEGGLRIQQEYRGPIADTTAKNVPDDHPGVGG